VFLISHKHIIGEIVRQVGYLPEFSEESEWCAMANYTHGKSVDVNIYVFADFTRYICVYL